MLPFHAPVEGVLIHLVYRKHGTKIAEILADQNALDSVSSNQSTPISTPKLHKSIWIYIEIYKATNPANPCNYRVS